MRTWLVALGIITAGLIGTAPSAQADTVVYNLTSDHCTGGCGTAPFGTVTLTTNGGNVDVTVDLNSGYSFVKTGAGDDQAFKFNGVGVVLGDITVDAHVPVLVAATGAFNGDGGGDYDFGINCPSCAGGGAGAFSADITFHVANASIADLTQPNNLNQIFVADVLAPNGNTGLVDVSGTPVPEPSSLLLIGSGFVLAGVVRRRWKGRQ
jgi:hypothetical protein